MKKKVFICGLVQESNSFNPVLTDFEDFSTSGIYDGQALLDSDGRAGETLNGMICAARQRGLELVGGRRMRSKSGGPVDHAVVEDFLKRTLDGIEQTGALDGVLLSLHGATVSDRSDDVCGDIVQAVRRAVGQKAAIAVSLDLHGNVTRKMMENADFVCGYQTYPHLDLYEVGFRAARLLADRLEGRPLVTVRAAIPMIAPPHGYTTTRGSLHELMERGHALVRAGQIADFSVFQAQPWLDVSELASTVVVTADSREAAVKAARELTAMEFALRHELQGEKLWSVEQVIQAARDNTLDKPVVLVDSADSPNAGANGDSAAVLEKLLPFRDELYCALSVNDAAAVERAFSMGVGARGDFVLGASLAPGLSRPVEVKDAVVRSLHMGRFRLQGPAERGQMRNVGRSAVLEAGKLQILVCVRAQNCGDRQFYRAFGIEPDLCGLVCVKACTSFRAGYEPMAAMICSAATPGAAGPVLEDMPFTRLPRPMFPFNEITEEDIQGPEVFR